MNACELIDAMCQAGATLVIADGQTRVRGMKVPVELLAALKVNKAMVLAEWERRQKLYQDRSGMAPEGDVPRSGRDVALNATQRVVVMEHVLKQPKPVHKWVMFRMVAYHELGVPPEDCDACACVDVVAWQRDRDAKQALEWLWEEAKSTKEIRLLTTNEKAGAT